VTPLLNGQSLRLCFRGVNEHQLLATKGSLFELVYRRLVGRLGHAQAIGAVAHRLCRLVWKVLHDGATYEERGPEVNTARAHRRAAKMIRELRSRRGSRTDKVGRQGLTAPEADGRPAGGRGSPAERRPPSRRGRVERQQPSMTRSCEEPCRGCRHHRSAGSLV